MYGRAKPMPDLETLKHLQPFSCEWLQCPIGALSELSKTLRENVELLQENPGQSIRKKKVLKSVDATTTILPKLEQLNSKSSTPADKTHVKDVLHFFLEEDEKTEEFMEQIFHRSTAVYLTSLHYLVAKHLLSNPKEYAQKVQAKRGNDGVFKQRKTVKEMKHVITAVCVQSLKPITKPCRGIG